MVDVGEFSGQRTNEVRATTCDICCDTSRRLTQCCRCQILTCRTCDRRMVETDESCPRCRLPWDEVALHNRLGPSFHRNALRSMRRVRLVRDQLARVDDAHVREAVAIRRRREISARLKDLRRLYRSTVDDDDVDARSDLLQRIRSLRFQLRNVAVWDTEEEARGVQEEDPSASNAGSGRGGNVRRLRVRCAHDVCGGFVDGLSMRCLRCSRRTCVHCEQPVGEESVSQHTCDPDLVRSVREVRDSTRPCPSCQVPSTRIDGCSVMWCPHCHVFWDWETRRSIRPAANGAVPHNPDHREWMRTRGLASGRVREAGDLPCGGFPPLADMTALIIHDVFDSGESGVDAVQWEGCIQIVVDAHFRLRASYRRRMHDDDPFRSIVIDFLASGQMDEAELARRLERKQRSLAMRSDVAEVVETFVFSGLDVIQRFWAGATETSNATSAPFPPVSSPRISCRDACTEIMELVQVTNGALQLLEKVHGQRTPRIIGSGSTALVLTWQVPNERGETRRGRVRVLHGLQTLLVV